MRSLCVFTLAAGALAGSLAPSSAGAQQAYSFSLVAKTRSGDFQYSAPPSINDSGVAAFIGTDGFGSRVFVGSGGPLTELASTGPLAADFATFDAPGTFLTPSINNSGNVAFWAQLRNGTKGFFVRGQSPLTIATDLPGGGPSGGTFGSFDQQGPPSPWLNNNGSVTFWGDESNLEHGVYSGSGGAITPLYAINDGSFAFLLFGANPAADDGGNALFSAVADGTVTPSYFRGSGIPNTATEEYVLDGVCPVLDPAMSDGGSTGVILSGPLGCGGEVFRDHTLIGDTFAGPFAEFRSLALSGTRSVLLGSLDSLGDAIATADSSASIVVRTGDPMFGDQVYTLELHRQGVNESGQIAFLYRSIGSSGIVIATPIPPPCTDGIDNDGDGKRDFGTTAQNDPGCSSAADTSELGTKQCDDGIDNDGDGRWDYRSNGTGDPACSSAKWNAEVSQCQDGLDNDGQTGTDFDGGFSINGQTDPNGPDPQCTNATITSEAPPPPSSGCGIGPELAAVIPVLWAARRRRRR
jgi:hypothetical protein